MIKTHIFNDTIDKESVEGLIAALEPYVGEEIHLYFSTEGGYVMYMNYLLHFLNLHSSNITIFLTHSICSAGTFILTDFMGEIIITDDLQYILFHKIDSPVYTLRKDGNVDSSTYIGQIKAANKSYAKKFRDLGLTDEEVNQFNEGRDVILYRKDFKRLETR